MDGQALAIASGSVMVPVYPKSRSKIPLGCHSVAIRSSVMKLALAGACSHVPVCEHHLPMAPSYM